MHTSDVKIIGKHINNVFNKGELNKTSVVAKFATTAINGKKYKTIKRSFKPYSNFLAWILNDKESHMLGDFPIKKFLELLVLFSKDRQLDKYKNLNKLIIKDLGFILQNMGYK